MRRPDTHARAHVLPRSPDELSSCKWAAAVYPSALRAIRCCASHPARPPLRRTPFERSPRDLHEGMPRVATRPRARWRASSVDRATMCADTCCLALQCPRRHGLPALPGPCPRAPPCPASPADAVVLFRYESSESTEIQVASYPARGEHRGAPQAVSRVGGSFAIPLPEMW
jgi:hypothetical protein